MSKKADEEKSAAEEKEAYSLTRDDVEALQFILQYVNESTAHMTGAQAMQLAVNTNKLGGIIANASRGI